MTSRYPSSGHQNSHFRQEIRQVVLYCDPGVINKHEDIEDDKLNKR